MRLDDAYGVDQWDRVRLRRNGIENRLGAGRPSSGSGSWHGMEPWKRGQWRKGLTCTGAAAEQEMQDEREYEAREPSLEAAARRTSGSASSLGSKKTARKRVRQERSRVRRISRRYAASSHPRASIACCASAVAVAMGRRLLEVLAASDSNRERARRRRLVWDGLGLVLAQDPARFRPT